MSARESWTRRLAQRTERDKPVGSTPPARAPLMNTWHRCDRCGAQAYARALFRSHRELLFCAHHYRQHAAAVAKVAVEIQDETARVMQG